MGTKRKERIMIGPPFRQRELRHKTDGAVDETSSEDDPNDDYKSQKSYDDEEERQIQARLNKLVALSRSEEAEASGSDQRRRHERWSNDQGRDCPDFSEKRSRRRDESRERQSSRSYGRSREERSEESPNRHRSSRWDGQDRKKSPKNSGASSRSRRLVDY